MECCYKVFRRQVLEQVELEEDRFGFEPEITAKVAKLDVRIYETAVHYSGRTFAEGKKINWRDGMSAFRCILKYNLWRRGTCRGAMPTAVPPLRVCRMRREGTRRATASPIEPAVHRLMVSCSSFRPGRRPSTRVWRWTFWPTRPLPGSYCEIICTLASASLSFIWRSA